MVKRQIRQAAAFIDRWHWLILALASPLLLFPSAGRSPALLVVPVLWGIALIAKRQPLPSTPLNSSLLLLMIMVLVSLYATYDIAFSLPKLSGMVLAVGVFFGVARESQRARGWWLSLLVFMGIGLGIAAISLLGTHFFGKISLLAPITSRLAPRFVGLPGAEEGFHPNTVAGTLLWVMPLFMALSIFRLGKTKDLRAATGCRALILSLVVILATAVILGVFALTESRAGYVAFALSTGGLLALALLARWRWLGLMSLALVSLILVAVVWQAGRDVDPVELSSKPELALDSLQWRMEVWSRAIKLIEESPLTGMGMNTFRQFVHVPLPFDLTRSEVDIGHAHNEFLQAALDLGIPGLIAFIALLIGAFWMLQAIWTSPGTVAINSPRLMRTFALGLGGGLLAHMLFALTDAVSLGARSGVLFWMLLGLIAGLFAQTPRHKTSPRRFTSHD